MNLFICGSIKIKDKKWIFSRIEECIAEMNFTNVTILEGEARGVDRIAKEWALAHNISVKEYPPDVQHNLHNVACHKRNEDMILAVEKYGAIKGFSKGIKRILRCHKPKEELIILRVGGKSANSSN